nr:MAG TPA: hypothetical protein [Caudoviricetes sp.]
MLCEILPIFRRLRCVAKFLIITHLIDSFARDILQE